MKYKRITIKTFVIIFLLTWIWFASFSGSSEITCSGESAGKGYGNFVLWNMADPTTSLSKLVDLKMFITDLLLSYALTALIYFLILMIFRIEKSIFQTNRWFFTLLFSAIFVGLFFSPEFMFGLNFQIINCDRVMNTFTFGLRIL